MRASVVELMLLEAKAPSRIAALFGQLSGAYRAELLAEATALNAAAYGSPARFGAEPSHYMLQIASETTCPTP